MKEDVHARLRIYWERTGKPQLEFKHGDDPWVEVAGKPSWHPSFRYRIKGMHADDIAEMPTGDAQWESGYRQGYAQAIADMKNLILKCENT